MMNVEPVLKEIKLEAYRVRAYCPNDGSELRWDHLMLASNPPMYDHTCPRCDYQLRALESYPATKHREV